MNLRPYQQDLFNGILDGMRQGIRSQLVVAPTGSGKTATFCHIAHRSTKQTLILVHRRELVSQTSATLAKFRVPHGIIQPGVTPDPTRRVQLGMVQTIARRVGRIEEPSLIVVDEAHHAVAGQYRSILEAFPRSWVIGFTATPLRLDGRGLRDYFDRIVPGPTVEWLMANGFLCRPKYYAPPMMASLKGVKKRFGDYVTSDVAEAMSGRVVTGDAVAHYRRICDGARAVAFCCNIRHAEIVRDGFKQAGISSDIIQGDMTGDDRTRVVDGLASGNIRVLVSVDVVSEGFDIPAVEAAILLRPTQSLGLYLQQIGRVLRPAQGKTAYVLDHAGNVLRHGFAEDPRDWSLDGVEKKESDSENDPPTKQCQSCFCVYARASRACPECGHENEAPKQEINQIDGELVELRAGTLSRRLKDCKTREDLKRLAKARGYKPGFVYYKAKELGIR